MRRDGRFPVGGAYALALVALMVALGGGAYALQGKNTVNSGDVRNETLRGRDLADGSIRRADISDAAEGARAYGQVSASGELVDAQGIASVTTPVNGGYCLEPEPSIDASTATLLLGANFDHGSTPADVIRTPQWIPGLVHCPEGTLEVVTFELNSGGGIGRANNSFAFVVP
jgi:hypothetical protein